MTFVDYQWRVGNHYGRQDKPQAILTWAWARAREVNQEAIPSFVMVPTICTLFCAQWKLSISEILYEYFNIFCLFPTKQYV